MAEFDVEEFLKRFRERAEAVRDRGLPPVAGEERRRLIEQAELDYADFMMVGSATWTVEDDALVLRIPLRRG
jgi:hypothetical protein